jgi:hypothetical protein
MSGGRRGNCRGISAKDDHGRLASGEALQSAIESDRSGIIDSRESQQIREDSASMAATWNW